MLILYLHCSVIYSDADQLRLQDQYNYWLQSVLLGLATSIKDALHLKQISC